MHHHHTTPTVAFRQLPIILISWVLGLLTVAAPAIAANDSLTIIRSFYRNSDDAGLFTTTKNGDTVALVYTAHINKHDSDLDTSHIQVRTWQSITAKTLATFDFFHVQASATAALYRVGNINGAPHLVYTSSTDTMKVVNMLDGTTVRSIAFPDVIWRVFMSPDNSHSFVTTRNDQFFVVDMVSGTKILQDSVWRNYVLNAPSWDQYRGLYNVHFKVSCEPNSWSADNSMIMIRVDRWTDTIDKELTIRYERYWRPYDLVQKKFIADTIDFQAHGKWLPNAKRFVTFTAQKLYITKLDLSRKIVETGKYIYDYGWLDNSNHMTIVDPGTSISVWDMDATTKLKDFSPGSLIGYTFNRDAQLLAYVTSDNVITVMNTNTFQGIYSIKIPFEHAISFSDRSTFRFLDGDMAMVIQDTARNYRILDLATSTVVVVVDSNVAFDSSPDGTALFVVRKQMTRYDLFTGLSISTFPQNELVEHVQSIAISPDGQTLVSLDSSLRCWNARSGALNKTRACADATTVLWTSLDSLVVALRGTGDEQWITVFNAYTLDSLYSIGTNMHFLGLSANGKSILTVGQRESLFVFNVRTGAIETWIAHFNSITAACTSQDGTLIGIGDTNGAIRIFNATSKIKLFEHNANRRVRSIVLGSTNAYLSFISDIENTVLKIPEGTQVQSLSTPTRETLFINHDSLCVGIYDEAIVEFYMRNGHPSKFETATRAYFRPMKNYFAVTNPDARDSLALFDYSNQRCDRALRNMPINRGVLWSAHSNALAAIDIFNNIVIWTPANLKSGDIESSVTDGSDPLTTSVNVSLLVGGQMWVRCTNGDPVADVKLIDLLGQYYVPTVASDGVFNIQNLSSGMYLVEARLRDGRRELIQTIITQ